MTSVFLSYLGALSTILQNPLSPVIFLSAMSLAALLVPAGKNVSEKAKNEESIAYFSIFSMMVCFFIAFFLFISMKLRSQFLFSGLLVADPLSSVGNLLFVSVSMIVLVFSMDYQKKEGSLGAEYYALILTACSAMMFLVMSNDLLMVFLSLEALSLPLYILTGYRKSQKSLEASLKYFFMGAYATCFFVYGTALVFGAAGTTRLNLILDAFKNNTISNSPLLYAGFLFIFVAVGFKVALFPFHMWLPDAYEGAPTPIAGFMVAVVKAAGFTAALRIFAPVTSELMGNFIPAFQVLAVLTMTAGNTAALIQKSVKRMLAYSSIAHAGYLFLGFISGNNMTESALWFYFMGYAFANLGAFCVLTVLSPKGENDFSFNVLRGKAITYPWVGFCMTVFMLSLTGIPPSVGFFGKFYLFSAAVKSGFISAAVIAFLNSVVSAYYYLKVVAEMFEPAVSPQRASIVPDSETWSPVPDGRSFLTESIPVFSKYAIIACALAILLYGLFPSPLLSLVSR